MASSSDSNNNNQEEDPWAELFDRAEGKITLEKNDQRCVVGKLKDDDDDDHQDKTVVDESATAANKRPKLQHHVSKTSKAAARRDHSNAGDDNVLFQKYLKERSAFQTQLRLEDGIVLKEAFSATTTSSTAADIACQEWTGAKEGQPQNKQACCQSCGRSSFYHRAAANAVDEDNNNIDHTVLLPLQLYCLLRNLRHVAILFLTTTSSTAEEKATLLGQQHHDVGGDACCFVGRALQGECQRLLTILQAQSHPELASSLQAKFTTLQTLLQQQQQQQQEAFKKRKKQKTTTTTHNNNNNNSSSPMSVQQQQQHQARREGAIRIMMQCDECYYQLYYLEITRQLVPGLFSSSLPSSKHHRGSGARAGLYIPHPTVYVGETYTIPPGPLTNKSRDDDDDDDHKHYLDSARVLVSTWKSLDYSSVAARFQLDFEQQPSVATASGKGSMDMDALSALHYIRFLETITFFDLPKDTAWLSSSSSSASSSSLLSKRDKSSSSSSSLTAPPPAPVLLMAWRDSCRDFLTHLYAYATLPPKLITSILKTCRQEEINNIIEVGAGTGYVAHLFNMQQQGSSNDIIGIEAYDLLPTPPPPPSSSENAATTPTTTTTRMNEYHGDTPPFTHVAKASCTQALQNNKNNINNKTALLLCYPPPDSSMALDAVQMFCRSTNSSSNNSSSSTRKKRRRQRHQNRGNDDSSAPLDTDAVTSGTAGSLVIYIGEFQGLTGTRELERYLMQNFDCMARHACPTWGTDATSVTIWKARKHPVSSSPSSSPSSLLIPCHYCQEKPATKRLRCIRHLEYCSKTCFQADCQSGVVYQHAKCSRLYLGGGGGTTCTTGGAGTGAANDTADMSKCALDFENNKQHFLDLT